MTDRSKRRTALVLTLLAGLGGGWASWFMLRPTIGSETEDPMTNAATETQPAHTNRLIDATSPYLLQHAHNPVDWYPWGEEALNKARTEDKPIFLSIGYSACHWCHVMERESFENEKIARELNEHFVPIKVDREERPDLDAVYMDATMLANQGQGGWPMSVFLTPDGKPFFAGTYFPPHSSQGMPGFMEVLQHIARLWDEDRDKITQSATALSDAVRQLGELSPSDSGLSFQTVGWAVDKIADAFDGRTGGILSGHTNKFPPSMAMSLMLRDYLRSKQAGEPKQRLIDLVTLTLDHMAHGGIYDHLGGGIARYSTDSQWLAPHFEKMLYDQALVSAIYLEGHQLTGKPFYADVARDIFDYVLADLHSSEGGFYSSRDADSEGVEGKYYVWSRDEIMEALGERNGKLFCSYYDVTEGGNWEGHNILNVPRGISAVARLNNVEVDDLKRVLAEGRASLLRIRERRVPPGLDDKVLTAWNGLMIASMARGGRILGDEQFVAAAARAGDFILEKMTRDGRLLRAYRAGKAHTGGYLDDYAFFVDGLLELYLATGDLKWLEQAERLNADMIEHFHDDAEGAFFFTADDAEGLFVRSKDLRDGAIPSGNSVAVMNLLRLAVLLDRPELRQVAEQAIRAVAGSVQQMPFSHERLLAAVDFLHSPHTEVVIVGPEDGEATGALLRAAYASYDPNRMVLRFNPNSTRIDEHREKVPLMQGRGLVRGQPAAYVCRNRTCGLPATSTTELVEQLSQSSR